MTAEQKFYREAYALESMNQAQAILDHISSSELNLQASIKIALWRFFVVSALPLTNNFQPLTPRPRATSRANTARHPKKQFPGREIQA